MERVIYAAAIKSAEGFVIRIRKLDSESLDIKDRDEIKAVISKTGNIRTKVTRNFDKDETARK